MALSSSRPALLQCQTVSPKIQKIAPNTRMAPGTPSSAFISAEKGAQTIEGAVGCGPWHSFGPWPSAQPNNLCILAAFGSCQGKTENKKGRALTFLPPVNLSTTQDLDREPSHFAVSQITGLKLSVSRLGPQPGHEHPLSVRNDGVFRTETGEGGPVIFGVRQRIYAKDVHLVALG